MTPSPMPPALPWVVLGVRDSKRSTGLQAARHALGLPPATLVTWRDWLHNPNALTQHFECTSALASSATTAATTACIFKIEPPGDDPEAHHHLMTLGCHLQGVPPPLPLAYGEWRGSHHWFVGMSHVMQQLERTLAAYPHVRVVNAPADIIGMTDKWQCQATLAAQDLPIPTRLGLVCSYDEWLACLDQHPVDRVFLKARYGSSAAGVLAFRRNRQGQMQAITSARWRADEPERLTNVKRMCHYSQESAIRAVVTLIAEQEAYVEHWLPKPRCGARHFDLRILTLGGHAAHCLGRVSTHPMTNLHLDSLRIAPETVLDAAALQLARHTAECAAQAAFPRSTVIGWDVIARPHSATLLEANAFGDLLPRWCWQGQDSYAAQTRALSVAAV